MLYIHKTNLWIHAGRLYRHYVEWRTRQKGIYSAWSHLFNFKSRPKVCGKKNQNSSYLWTRLTQNGDEGSGNVSLMLVVSLVCVCVCTKSHLFSLRMNIHIVHYWIYFIPKQKRLKKTLWKLNRHRFFLSLSSLCYFIFIRKIYKILVYFFSLSLHSSLNNLILLK